MSAALRALFWLALLTIAAATLCPIDWRPETGLPPDIERFGAFLAISLLFTLGYPRRRWSGLLVLIGIAALLEVMQELVPGRHGRLLDAEVKAAGVVVGAALGMLLLSYRRVGPRPRDEGIAGR